MFCVNCGKELHSDMKFCPECGQDNFSMKLPPPNFSNKVIRNLWADYKQFWLNYSNYQGKSTRTEYWSAVLFNALSTLILSVLSLAFFLPISRGSTSNFAYFMFILPALWGIVILLPCTFIVIRRLHDAGKSGFWAFLSLCPPAWIVLLIFLCQPTKTDAVKEKPVVAKKVKVKTERNKIKIDRRVVLTSIAVSLCLVSFCSLFIECYGMSGYSVWNETIINGDKNALMAFVTSWLSLITLALSALSLPIKKLKVASLISSAFQLALSITAAVFVERNSHTFIINGHAGLGIWLLLSTSVIIFAISLCAFFYNKKAEVK